MPIPDERAKALPLWDGSRGYDAEWYVRELLKAAASAAEAGKHVFSEKPTAGSVAEGLRMMASCQRAEVVLSIAHLQRRMGAMRRMKEMMNAGKLGKVIQAEASFGTSTGLSLTSDKFAKVPCIFAVKQGIGRRRVRSGLRPPPTSHHRFSLT